MWVPLDVQKGPWAGHLASGLVLEMEWTEGPRFELLWEGA